MKQFLETNTITYNLMSFTGFKSILIFSLLMESPKSYEEIQTILQNHKYLHEKVSIDAIRIYFNSLRAIGCIIQRVRENGVSKYYIESHPFELRFTDNQIEKLIKIYKAISKSIDVSDLISLKQFFNKISNYISSSDYKLIEKLQVISPLYGIDSKLLQDLMSYALNNSEVTVLYNSPNSGLKNIKVDELYISCIVFPTCRIYYKNESIACN
mgnify:CR=1 FL=1